MLYLLARKATEAGFLALNMERDCKVTDIPTAKPRYTTDGRHHPLLAAAAIVDRAGTQTSGQGGGERGEGIERWASVSAGSKGCPPSIEVFRELAILSKLHSRVLSQ